MKVLGLKIPSVIKKLRKPAQVYLILSVISVLFYIISMIKINYTVLDAEPEGEGIHQYTVSGVFIKVIFTILWVCILNYICQFKYGKKIAWFIVIMPFFFMGLMLIGLMYSVSFIALQNNKQNELKQKVASQSVPSIAIQEPSIQTDKPKDNEYKSELLR